MLREESHWKEGLSYQAEREKVQNNWQYQDGACEKDDSDSVTQAIGGIVDQDCTAFLSDNSEDDQVELGINSQRHLAIVLPLTALKSRDITDLSECK